MKIGSLFVRRPVMTSMVFLGIALFGALSWTRLPQELFPNISVPQLVIITPYANAAPEEIENLITKPIEEAVGTLPNLKRVRSVSKEGLSAVTLEFHWGTDMGFAHLSTREKLDRIKDKLPHEAEESIIKRVNPFTHPVVVISVTGDLPLPDMTDLCENVIKKKLEKTEGVAAVNISGGQKREILVEVDRGRLDASRVSLPMVVDALKNANYDYPAGVTQGRTKEFLVRTHGRFTDIKDVGKTIVQVENPEFDPVYGWRKSEERNQNGAPREQRFIALNDLAEIRYDLKERKSYSRFNGRENIAISIQKQAQANTVEVSRAVGEALEELKLSLPKSMTLSVIYDESQYILASLANMRNNVFIGGLLAFLVLFYFLGNVRDSLNVGLALPVSIFAALLLMDLTGLSINMLTLAGLALAVGTLADGAIVVAENISRHRKEFHKGWLDAAIDGVNEMMGPMMSATLTNIAVFLPLLFISGIAQKLFQDLFMVTVFTAIAGLFVSLTLIPRLAGYYWTPPGFLKFPGTSRWVLSEKKAAALNDRYAKELAYFLDHQGTLVLVLLMMALLAGLVMWWTPKVFMPKMDQGQFMVELTMPIGTRLAVTNKIAQKLESLLSGKKGVDVMVNVGSAEEEEKIDALDSHQAQIVVTLDPARGYRTDEVIETFKKRAKRENLEDGHLTYILQDSPLRAALAGGAPVEVEIKGPEMDRLRYFSNELVKQFEEDPQLFGVKTTFALPSRETQVVVDKDQASGFQLSVADIARTAMIAIRGYTATKFKKGGKETDIRVRLREAHRRNSSSIRHLALRSPRGMMVPLNSVASIKSGRGASEIRHLDQQRAVVVTAEVGGGGVDNALKRVQSLLGQYRHFKDYTVVLGGESRQMAESFASLKFTFFLAILLVYMIMAAQFESLTQPLIIMLTVPFAFMGVAYTLFITNTPLSSVVTLGVVILSGLVVNNGIVLIDHMNGLRAKGMPLRETILTGAQNRLRPVLVTSITTILAVLPLAVGIGRGDDLAQPLAVVTFGGLFVSTFLTLLVIPILYYKLVSYQETRKP